MIDKREGCGTAFKIWRLREKALQFAGMRSQQGLAVLRYVADGVDGKAVECVGIEDKRSSVPVEQGVQLVGLSSTQTGANDQRIGADFEGIREGAKGADHDGSWRHGCGDGPNVFGDEEGDQSGSASECA